ncbi:MAG: hypothetical protein AB8G05_07460 [Oligoflexales bacterium]
MNLIKTISSVFILYFISACTVGEIKEQKRTERFDAGLDAEKDIKDEGSNSTDSTEIGSSGAGSSNSDSEGTSSNDDNSSDDEGTSSNENTPPPPPPGGKYKLNDTSQNQYLGYVEKYIESQTRQATASDDSNAYTVRTYDVEEGELFYAASDTYDNALVSIFFTVIGKPQKSAKILDSWLRMHKWTLANDNYRKGLFWPKVNHIDLGPASWIDNGGDFLDVGNNSMMALAFCRYYLQFADDAPNTDLHKEYYNASKAMMSEIHNNFQCTTGPYRGYMGRPTSTKTAYWQSIEHNLDMYALGTCVQEAAKIAEPGVNTISEDVQKVAGTFVSQMYDSANKRYRTGTEPACNANTAQNNAFVPVDAITWRHLAKAEADSMLHADRSEESMTSLVTPTFMIQDPDFTSKLGQPIWGVKFTNIGTGIQGENTGAALLALNDFHQNNASEDIDKLRSGVKAMFDQYGNSGIPAHSDTPDGSCCNTGITWSYYFTPHTASTVYFGLALAYQFERNGQIIPGMNPYFPGSSNVEAQESVQAPQL